MLPSHTSFEELQEIRKAFEANTASTGANPFVDGSSGAALSRQSLDTTFVALVSTDKDFRFLKQLPRRDVKQVLAEYNVNKSHGGGWYNNSYIGQSDEPQFTDAVLKRMFDEMNYLSQGYQYNKVAETVDNVQDPEVIQSNAALRRLAESMSRAFFFGDKSVNPLSQNGFLRKIKDTSASFTYDCRNQLPDQQVFKEFSAQIRTSVFGIVNQCWMSPATKTLYDQNYEVLGKTIVWQNQSQNPGNVRMGNIIAGINDGNALDNFLSFEDEIWLDRHQWSVPMVWDQASQSFIEGATSVDAPTAPTFTAVPIPAVLPGSKFSAADAGIYNYRVAAGNYRGYSQAAAAVTANVPADGGATITITPAGTGNITNTFVIFRETSPGSGIIRWMDEVVRTPIGNTVYIDMNENIPGTTIMVLGDFNSRSNSDENRTHILSELLPPFKTLFPYGAGNKFRSRTGIVEAYNVLQVLAPEKFRVMYNVPVVR